MRRLIGTLAVIGAIAWSLIAWGLYALVGWAGGIAAGNADIVTGHPETVELLGWLASVATGLGLFGVGFVWFIGIMILAAAAALLRRIVGGPAPKPLPR